jgi:outer membrane protein assembly factor BamA
MRRFALLTLILLSIAPMSWSKIFVLPGVSYDSDVGGVIVLYMFYRDQNPGRIAFSGMYTTKGSQSYAFEAIRPWKGAEWEVYLAYSMENWMRYDPFNDDYHKSVVEAMASGITCRLGSEIPLEGSVNVGGVIGFENYHFFDFDIEEEDHPGASTQFKLARQLWTNLDETYVGVRITRDRRDNRYHTTRGSYSRFEYQVVHLSAGVNPYVFRATGDVRVTFPLWDLPERYSFPKLVWAQMAKVGYIFSDVPNPILFRIGGGSSLRGFPWKRFEGRGMALYRNELRLTLVDHYMDPITKMRSRIPNMPELKPGFEFATFADIGTTWYERLHADRIHVGYGVGLRVILPADVVARVDVAWPDDGHYWGLYVELSQSF